ncbi:MAG: nucleoside triphosphate pyrophosphohydrolase [Proteobacteria bacterium]|nr:nucleoside triphosphate pyrophosphohydrolase [Pseudomonadota bacterium]
MKKTDRLFIDMIDIIRRLRSPGGCPWDQKQTPQDVKAYLIEELYELLEGIDAGDPALLQEEVGDILFMIAFLVNLYEEKRVFTMADALEQVTAKMVHRHPHVFGDTQVHSADDVKANWQVLKEKEGKKPKSSHLDGIPGNLPSLSRSWFLTAKAAEVGFDWAGPRDVLRKVREEIDELEAEIQRGDTAKAAAETGDLLFSIANLARHLGIEPEQALRAANDKFTSRFAHIEQALQRQGKKLKESTLEEMDSLWDEAKQNNVT